MCSSDLAVAVLDLPVTLIGLLPPTEALFPVVVTAQSRLLAITKADPETTLSPRLAEVGVRLHGAWGGAHVGGAAPHQHRSRALPTVVHQPDQGPDATAPDGVGAAGPPHRAARHHSGAMMRASVTPRHRAPTRWARGNNAEDDQLVTVAWLLAQNQRHLSWYQQVLHRREHANHARRITVMPRPRTAPD